MTVTDYAAFLAKKAQLKPSYYQQALRNLAAVDTDDHDGVPDLLAELDPAGME